MKDRKMFKFYRSYYDIALELPEKDRLAYLMAILEVQFTGNVPQLTGLARFAFISQQHSIQAQINGFKALTGESPSDITPHPAPPIGAKPQLKEEYKEEEEYKIKRKADFDVFWKMYGKSKDKEYCLRKFMSLKQSDVDAIFKTLPDYVKSTPELQYRKYPKTYLNGKCWNDEIEMPSLSNLGYNSRLPDFI